MGELKSIYCIAILMLFVAQLVAQPTEGLIAYYSFDGCDATDDLGTGRDGVLNGNPECGCGAVGNALIFDGVDDWIGFGASESDALSKDFTVSFYIAPENTTGTVDIFARRKLCQPDSAAAIRYEPATRTLRAELTEGINERAEITTRLNEGRCWYHITWVRSGQQMMLYIDGVLASLKDFDDRIDARNSGELTIANSPCLANGEVRFAGALDEFRVYGRVLSPDEIMELYIPIDRLITQDTVVFLGTGVQISLSNSCASSYLWTPQAGVDVPDDPEPFITPLETATYGLLMDYGFCKAADTIRIIAVDSSELKCEDVFLPNAFTPNMDGLNDDYGMSNANFFLGEFQSMDIYDRFGSKLFTGMTPYDKWDGRINGEDALPGIYIYKVRFRCNAKDQISTGSFNLLR
jgi:gliding motility-associated-like protein